MEIETLEQHTKDQHNNFEGFVDSVSENRIKEINLDDKNRRAVGNTDSTVEKGMHAAIFTAMDEVLIPKVEMAVK